MELYKNKEWLIQQYETKSVIEISKEVGISKQALLKWFKKFNIKRRQGSEAVHKGIYNYNVNYFKDINTHAKAYWLGFIMADGCITKTKYGYMFEMNLQLRDKLHVLQFAKDINFTNKTIDVFNCKDPNGNLHTKTYIKIENKEFCDNLMKHNIYPNKTGKESFPNIKRIYYKDFIRGFFDGDGCITYAYRKDKPNTMGVKICIVCMNREFLESIKKILEEEAYMSFGDSKAIYKTRSIYSLEICKLESVKKFYNYIYTDRCRCLSRKKEKFIEPLNYINSK